MSESWTTPSEHTPEAPAPGHDSTTAGPDDTPVAPAVDPGADELVVLDRLEADLSAVEQAIESLEQVSTEGLVGEAAALRIAAAVSTERFGPGVDG
jgi:hypothetical protein